MPAISIRVTAAQRSGGRVTLTWEDGSQTEFLLSEVRELISVAENIEVLRRLWLGYWIARSNDLSDATAIVNRTLTMDLSAANPFRIT